MLKFINKWNTNSIQYFIIIALFLLRIPWLKINIELFFLGNTHTKKQHFNYHKKLNEIHSRNVISLFV